MKFSLQTLAIALGFASLAASTVVSDAFALLGPVQPWMQATNGVIASGDIGGPMCLSNGYRWNVPVVTYGFDQTFLDYFGSNGVAAVKNAIQIFNNLPPASQIVLYNYPLDSQQVNFVAQSQSLYDLKSQTLSLLLEHLGLAQPTRYIFVIQQRNPILLSNPPPPESEWTDGPITNYIVQRNYDPQTLNVSTYINETLYSAEIAFFTDQSLEIVPILADPILSPNNAVAAFYLESGGFYTGLTYDDVGGLAFLLSTNTVNYETLLPGVAGVGTNANSFVNAAWRPGVDKITFIPQPVDSTSG
ncbi:MAG TPA: hypothetical protein VNX46_05420, partial [Candidatus Acidoferrum sp.]|nr:hypothetical protein [Candidatus Acidoferrum sp.]